MEMSNPNRLMNRRMNAEKEYARNEKLIPNEGIHSFTYTILEVRKIKIDSTKPMSVTPMAKAPFKFLVCLGRIREMPPKTNGKNMDNNNIAIVYPLK